MSPLLSGNPRTFLGSAIFVDSEVAVGRQDFHEGNTCRVGQHLADDGRLRLSDKFCGASKDTCLRPFSIDLHERDPDVSHLSPIIERERANGHAVIGNLAPLRVHHQVDRPRPFADSNLFQNDSVRAADSPKEFIGFRVRLESVDRRTLVDLSGGECVIAAVGPNIEYRAIGRNLRRHLSPELERSSFMTANEAEVKGAGKNALECSLNGGVPRILLHL